MRMKTVSHQPSALADTGGAKKLLRSQRSKDNRSTPHEIFHSRKTSQASKKN
jgi:hypothetical protein